MGIDKSRVIHLLVKPSESGGKYWVAHCLELGIVATADTEWKAVEMLAHCIQAQIGFALEHNNLHDIEFPDPEKYFAELACHAGREKS